jgi:hypothetical protein
MKIFGAIFSFSSNIGFIGVGKIENGGKIIY